MVNELKKIPKTLILVVDISSPGGVANYYRNLKLDAENEITYFTISSGHPQSLFATILRLIGKYIVFAYKIIREKYEVVLINPSLDLGKSFHRDMVFIMLARLLKKEVVVFFRGWFDPYEERIKKSRFKSFLFSISYAKVKKYIVLGSIFKTKLIGLGVPADTEFNIETTVADSSHLGEFDITKKYSTYQEKINFLFLSRIENDKGIYIAIDAFAEYAAKNPNRNSSLIVAGDGPDLPAVREYVVERKIPNIEFLGNVSGNSKKDVLLKSHIMIFPSLTEGLPNCVLEGMLYGMPIISRTTGGIPEVVHQNINGYLTESFSPSIFANFLSTLASDEELYKKMANDNHVKALHRYTVENVRERILNILKNIKP